MSTRYFCDSCEAEMRPEDHGRLKLRNGRIEIEVMHSLDLTWNKGHVCHKCIRHTIEHGHAVAQ